MPAGKSRGGNAPFRRGVQGAGGGVRFGVFEAVVMTTSTRTVLSFAYVGFTPNTCSSSLIVFGRRSSAPL